jgi:hypothetical protein
MSRYYNNWSDTLYYSFNKSDTINETFSQAYQDIFVLSVLDGKMNGSYLEIGCNVPDYTNNTYLLSKEYNWTGVSIDYIESLREFWNVQRSKDKFLACDALTVDYKQILDNNYNGEKVLDYLQCDIEPPEKTFRVLKRLPHDEYRFKVITFETDAYTGAEGLQVRQESRKFLSNLGYELIIGDVLVDGGNPYEDWWVAPDLVNMEVANDIKIRALTNQFPAKLLFK